MKSIPLLAVLIPLNTLLFAQRGILSISGQITDETGAYVSFAHVYIKGSQKGTVSNSEGRFNLKITVDDQNETVVFSAIGFQSLERSLNQWKSPQEIVLKESLLVLDEVVVNDEFQPKDILVGAIENFKENYKTTPHRLEGFYRTTFQQDGSFMRLLEAAIYVHSNGKIHNRQNVEFRHIRKSADLRTDKWKIYDGYVNHLVHGHPVQSSHLGFLKKRSLKFFEVDLLEVKAQDEDLLYVLLAKSKSNSQVIYDAQITIRDQDLAIVDVILKFKPHLSDNFSWAWERRDTAKFVADWQESHYTYQEFEGKYYLRSASWHRKGKVLNTETKMTEFDTESLDELLITDIKAGNHQKEESRDEDQNIYRMADYIAYNAEFWSNYTRPVDTEHFKSAKAKMEKNSQLDQQFEENTGRFVNEASAKKAGRK
ncbi:MAG: carboxypeptidase-like regulatory domain-containing protein [Bacteroidota bacterium]